MATEEDVRRIARSELITDSWMLKAPKRILRAYEDELSRHQ